VFSQSYIKYDLRKNKIVVASTTGFFKIVVASTTGFLGISTKIEALAPNL
jgi:hypothetical protein